MEGSTKKRRGIDDGNPAVDLTDDLIVEILSRLPVKSICRFKCVSWHWRGLISHRAHRKKLPQTLAGFISSYSVLHNDYKLVSIPHFDIIDGEEEEEHRLVPDPSLSFLPGYRDIFPKDCCNGLVLCLCVKESSSDYVVCNPATQKWMVLPEIGPGNEVTTIHLGFEPALSPYFHLFAIREHVDEYVSGLEIFSSETRRWSYREIGWAGDDHLINSVGKAAFVDGMMNFISADAAIVAVDTEGKKWKTIPLLEGMNCDCPFNGNSAFIGQSQGHLCYINFRDRDFSILSVWTLEDYCGCEWSFKYNISTSELLGWKNLRLEWHYSLIAIHPDCNVIFYVLLDDNKMVRSYNMDRGEVDTICRIRDPYWNTCDTFLPYVPVFVESLSRCREGRSGGAALNSPREVEAAAMECSTKKRCGIDDGNPAVDLTNDLIVEILSRLPVKSICRFKCVSWHWRRLISHRAHRKKLPQTLAGFISHYYDDDLVSIPHFDIIDGEEEEEEEEEEHRLVPDPTLSFMPEALSPKDCCNGLVLCLCTKESPMDEFSDYVVCNPATQKWMVLPEIDLVNQVATIRVGFDPALSPYFHLFAILDHVEEYTACMQIFSSETGRWSHQEIGWVGDDHLIYSSSKAAFVDGMMNFVSAYAAIVAVDTEGKKWKTIPLLKGMNCNCPFNGNSAFIGQSQGHLYYINFRDRDFSILSVWTLDDYSSCKWSFKYNISTSQLFGWPNLRFECQYSLIAIHPECNMIFYVIMVENGKMLHSYDMDRGEVNTVCTVRDPFWNTYDPFLPYVPVFVESLPDHD
uniref:F-box domain-containing protein n=1 Tax=Leersia perrieri TaxID=77586 RepID=A0A0D9WCJ1_9ORYZ